MTAVDVRLDHLAIAARYAAAPDQWPVAPRFNPVDRWYHRLAVADDHEVWLLTWLPGQGTDLHDHGGSSGAFLVFDGTLTEETVAPLRTEPLSRRRADEPRRGVQAAGPQGVENRGLRETPSDGLRETQRDRLRGARADGLPSAAAPGGPARIEARELGEGAGRRFGPRHIHRVTNRSSRPATSIHVYGPALTTMTRYRLSAAGLEIRTVEAAGVQW